MRKPIVLSLAVMLVAACGDIAYRNGQECNQTNILHCGQDSNGSPVALLCAGIPGQWMQVGACPSCDHVTNDQTALVCGGVNVAIAGNPCQVQNTGACDLGNLTHVLTCQVGKWTLNMDCSTSNQVCGFTAPNTLGCTLPKV